MSSSSSSSSSGGRGDLPWALLDRAPRVADLGPMATDADVLLDLVPPPGVSTAFLHRGLLPDDAAWDTARCRVEGADASGRLLIGFPSPRAPGESNLLVCRPLPVPKAKGRARFLPAVPEDTLGHAISTSHPTGIICDRGAKSGDHYFVAQLQTSQSSAPVVAVALCFANDDAGGCKKRTDAGLPTSTSLLPTSRCCRCRQDDTDCLRRGLSSYFVEVTPAGMLLQRGHLSGDVQRSACLDCVVCHLQATTPKSSWTETVNSAIHDGKQAVLTALCAVQKGRKYADSLPGAVQLVGGALSLPHTSALLTAANAIKTVNDSITIAENVSTWLWQHRPGAGLIHRVVGNMQETEAALNEWFTLNKPTNMIVDPDGDLSQQEWDDLRAFLVGRGAETLVQHYDYVLVEHPPR